MTCVTRSTGTPLQLSLIRLSTNAMDSNSIRVALSNRAPKHGVTRLVSHGARKQRMQQRALVLSLQRPLTCRLWPLPVLLLLKLRNDCRGASGRRVSPSAKHQYLRFVQSHRRALLPYESFTPHLPSAAAGATSDRETKRLLARAA